MELKYVVLTIIKIVISVPTIHLYHSALAEAAALMGGHLDNSDTNATAVIAAQNGSFVEETTNFTQKTEGRDSEEIPDPSPLVLPGYNLPENIFNKGKPFYLEKDPLTGRIDFDSKTPSLKLDEDFYDYVDEEPSSDLYDKANIDRKDGSLGSHRPSDVNQLTPNFHDFLNLPVKYNSDKYVYPLISSSYANTKIQGNVNKFHNHKDYNVKSSTQKPGSNPTYFSTTKKVPTTQSTTPSTTTSQRSTSQVYLTSQVPNLMNSGMGHPSFHEDFDYYDATERPKPSEIYLTTKSVSSIYLTTRAPPTTTKKTMSLFEQLFGDYDETVAPTEKTKPPPLFQNLPVNKNKYETETKTEKTSFTTPHYPNSHAGPNVLSGSNMGIESSYEYEEYADDNAAVESKPARVTVSNTVTVAPVSTTTPKVTSVAPMNKTKFDYEDYEEEDNKTIVSSTETTSTTAKVTSLPLGENHVTSLNNHQPIIVATQNLREQLNNEKVIPKPFSFDKPVQKPPSTSNIHIAPDQDTVSFVVGHHQNVATSLKESPYDSNPFRPLYGQEYGKDSVSYSVEASPELYKNPQNSEIYKTQLTSDHYQKVHSQVTAEVYKPVQNFAVGTGSAVTIQPQKHSEASLAIGVPVNGIKQVPGQVVDEKLEIDDTKIEFPKGTGPKVVFPDDKEPEVANLVPPPPSREVLKLNSKPMYHQLPSDLTPPKEKEVVAPSRVDRPRPPWDPRPGHFYSGKPEYVRPPRPPPEHAYKRIDNLPNILPQFRPNMGPNVPHHYLNRQPLLERPSNRPVGFFEKLQPPPPPKNLHGLRKIPPPPPMEGRPQIAEDRIINEGPPKQMTPQEQFYYQTPPKVVMANRRVGNVEGDVETLQMIQAKKSEKKDVEGPASEGIKEGTDKPLYVVYPVNTPPIKLDVIDSNKKESVVIGTRAELPLPPSKINQDFNYEQNPILNPKDRNDAPILKPHPRPSNFPIKSDFPYPLERPDPSILNPAVPETPSNNGNNLDEPAPAKFGEEPEFSGNQWNTVGENLESRIVTGAKQPLNQISVTLKTYTEKPIAVAYTPTEPHDNYDDKYSMPNYGSPVIPEIRPGTVDTVETGHGKPDSEFTVSAVMHTHPQLEINNNRNQQRYPEDTFNHKSDVETPAVPQLDFQAPFQASVSVDSMSQGWAVVRDRNKTTTEVAEVTTLPLATTSEFDIENFKPQLEGGFKPIYSFPEEPQLKDKGDVGEREE